MTAASTRTVLVIDDEADIREALDLALTLDGCSVTTAQDRDEALQLLQDGCRPDVVLMDYWMSGLSAPDFLERVNALFPGLTIVLMTAASPADKASQLGLQHFLRKPFDYDALIKLIHASD